ncbi:MAG: hypothetical protein ACI4PY_05145 [Akkermansia muciniphila]
MNKLPNEKGSALGTLNVVEFAGRLSLLWMRGPLSPVALGVLLCVASGATTRTAVRNRTRMNGGNCLVVLRHLVEKGYLRCDPPVYSLQPMGSRFVYKMLTDCFKSER